MPKANFAKVNLHDILRNSLSLFRDLESIQLEFETTAEIQAWVWADKEQLLRVFNNLLKYAVQAIPENKKGFIRVVLKQEENRYLVLITDNGIGIHPDIVNKIFVPNFTTKNGGMGLGLAMVKNIIEHAGGHI